jgi:hypothetical protein
MLADTAGGQIACELPARNYLEFYSSAEALVSY